MRLPIRPFFLLLVSVSLSACARGCGSQAKPVTGIRVLVKDAQGQPVLSRIAVLQPKAGQPFARPVTEAWAQAVSTGTVVTVAPGDYTVRAQGTGDSFLEAPVSVKKDHVSDVKLGFGTLLLDGSAVKQQGRVRVWQKRDGGEQIIVTRLVRVGEKAPIQLGQGNYRVAYLPDGLADKPELWQPFGDTLTLASGQTLRVQVP